MKDILLTEKEMVFLMLLYFHDPTMTCWLGLSPEIEFSSVFTSCRTT